MSNACTIYQLRVKLESCLGFSRELNHQGISQSTLDAYYAADILAFEEANKRSPEILQWSMELRLSTHVLLVLLDAIEACPSLPQLYAVMGLSMTKPFSAKDANGLVSKAEEVLSRTAQGAELCNNPALIAFISKRSGRPVEYFSDCRTRQDLIDQLVHDPVSHFLKSVAAHLGDELERSRVYALRYREALDAYILKNENGDFAKIARALAAKASPENYATYNLGRLAQDHLRQLAKRDTSRMFLADLYEKIKSRSVQPAA